MPQHRSLRHRSLWALLVIVTVLAGCGGGEDTTVQDTAGAADDPASADGPTDDEAPSEDAPAPTDAAADVADTETALPADATPDVPPVDGAAEEGDATAPAAGGCPTSTELTVTLNHLDGTQDVLLPTTTFAGAHLVLDLDGHGFGPLLAGVLTTDASADPVALADRWASPGTPPDGGVHVSVLLTGPDAGATSFPTGVYGVTHTDTVFAPTEGMGLDTLELWQPDGVSRPMNRDNELEVVVLGDGVACGEIRPTGREPGQSNPTVEVEGTFVATYAEQP